MKRIAKFEKVSKQQFEAAWEDTFGEKQKVYDEINTIMNIMQKGDKQ